MTTVTDTIEIPAAGAFRVDRHRSTISFTTRHLFGLGTVRGTFQLRDGQLHVASPVHDSSVRATIAAASFHTGQSGRDVNVRSARFLDTDNHPDITFVSTRLENAGGPWILHGTLTVRGRTRPLEVRVERLLTKGSSVHLQASARVDRYDFGITAMKGLTGRYLTLHLDIVADRT